MNNEITMNGEVKNIDLDKVCRVCLTIKKDMRPIFGEMVAEMLMEVARIQLEQTDGWPDKICIQCVHQVSRCHAFKSRVEKSDQELRQYIKGITVIVEEPMSQIQEINSSHHHLVKHENEIHITEDIVQNHQVQSQAQQNHHQQSQQQQQQHQQNQQQQSSQHHQTQTTQQIAVTTAQHHQPQQMIITNGQLHNAQIINAAGQILATTPIQSHLTTAQLQTGQICQLVQTGNGTVQMIQQNGQPAQVVQIQRTSDDRCEIIVQPSDLQTDGTTHYYTEDDEIFSVTQAIQQEEIEHEEILEQTAVCVEEVGDIIEEETEELITEDHIDEDEVEETIYTLALSDDDDNVDKEYMAEFISLQTSCPYPGLFRCNLCRKEFKHSKWLHSHMKSHENWIKANCKKQPQCEICHRSFKGPGMLKMHMKTHEKTPDRIPTCKICNKEFKSRTILYRHRQTHLEKSMQCGICAKQFSTISQLQSHQAKMNHEKIFKCSHCLQTFTAAGELKDHVLIHNNAKLKKDHV